MNNLASLNGKPRTLRVDGRDYHFYPLTLDDLGELQAWVDSVSPDPFAIAQQQIDSGRFTIEQGKHLLRVAMEMATKGAPKLGSDEADRLLQSPEGVKEVLYLAIRKGEPAFTRSDAGDLFRKVSQDDIAALYKTTGLVEAGSVGVAPDPKAHGSRTPTRHRANLSTGGTSTTGSRPTEVGPQRPSGG